MNIVEPKQDFIKIMDSELTFEQTVERVRAINDTLKEMNYNWEQIDAFWAGVFKKCKEIGLTNENSPCPHEIAEIEVIATCVTCEVTQVVCKNCKTVLSEPKTEC